MPAKTYDTSIDPNKGQLACSPDGTCDFGYTCATDATPNATPNTCVVPLNGGVGLAINKDGTHWWDAPDPGNTEAGTCDESCQRWISACVLARTNAYGVHVEISMRAPEDAPQAIKDALAVTDAERNGDGAGTPAYALREGAYFGNIFATTPMDPTTGAPATYPGTDGPATGPIASTPHFYACAGPGSNVPEITKRFCSSQGDQTVIGVPGVCLGTATEPGTCEGEDTDPTSPTFGAVQDCHTTGSSQSPGPCTDDRDPSCYNQVITVYLKQPIAVCGNGVCETGEAVSTDPGYCPSDCHPDTWAQAFTPPSISASAVLPDDSIVVAGSSSGAVTFGNATFPADAGSGVLARFASGGALAWALRFGNDIAQLIDPQGMGPRGAVADTFGLSGIAVAPNGNITVAGGAVHVSPDWSYHYFIWGSTYSQDGTQIGSTWAVPAESLVSSLWGFWLNDNGKFAVDSQGDVVFSGNYHDGNDWRLFLAKVSPQGDVVWAKSLLRNTLLTKSVAVDPHDNIVLVYSSGTSSELDRLCPDGSGPATDGAQDVCPDNSHAWNVPFDTTFCITTRFLSAATDKNGDVYATGVVEYGTNFGHGSITDFATVNLPPVVVKYGADSEFKWASWGKILCPGMVTGNCAPSYICAPGTQSAVVGLGLSFDASGNVVVASFGDSAIGGGIDFGVGTFPTYSSNNIFLSAYSPDAGALRWAKQIPTILTSSLASVVLDSQNRVVVSGSYSGSMQVDDRLLVTKVPEQPSVTESFLASFAAPSPLDKTPPVIGTTVDSSGATIDTLPQDIYVEATSAAGAMVFYMPPTATDDGNAGATVACTPPPNSTFPIGTTTVTCTASDPVGNRSSATFTVRVADTIAPAFTPIADLTIPATDASGAVVTYDLPTAVDQIDGSLQASCLPAPGSLFPVGKTQVTCTASDKSSNSSLASFIVTVTAPPASPNAVNCVGAPGAPVVVPTSPDTCSATVAGVGALGLGDNGIAATGCTSYYRVVDAQTPTATCVNQKVECGGNGGTSLTPVATCTDNCGCSASCAAGFFPLGSSLGTCTASDAAGNSSYCQPTVTVVDTTAPVVGVRPGPVRLQCHVDTWSDPGATAVDQCAGDLSAGITVLGTVDPTHVGSYTETYAATDPSGNSASASRTVSVVDTLAPTITLGSSPAALQCAVDHYVEAGAKASDACAGDLTSALTTSGAVNTGALGAYSVTYKVSDPAGNSATATRTVSVVDTQAPATTATVGPNPVPNRYINYNVTSYTVTPKGGGTPVTGAAQCWTSSGIAVTLKAADACGLKALTYTLAGAQTGAATVQGGNATFNVTQNGSTLVSYYATDAAGNAEAPKTLLVSLSTNGGGQSGFSCAPSPNLKNLPQHGTISASGTVTVTNTANGKTTSQPFSFTQSY
jgi:hypothetical protein